MTEPYTIEEARLVLERDVRMNPHEREIFAWLIKRHDEIVARQREVIGDLERALEKHETVMRAILKQHDSMRAALEKIAALGSEESAARYSEAMALVVAIELAETALAAKE